MAVPATRTRRWRPYWAVLLCLPILSMSSWAVAGSSGSADTSAETTPPAAMPAMDNSAPQPSDDNDPSDDDGMVSIGSSGGASQPAPSSPPASRPPAFRAPRNTGQDDFLTRIADERSVLFSGTAGVGLFKEVDAGWDFPLDLRVCGSALPECTRSEPLDARRPGEAEAAAGGTRVLPPRAQGGANSPLGDLRIRGRIRADLVIAGGKASVRLETDAVQLIADAGDIGRWRWTIRATEPDTVLLHLRITVLRGETTEALTTPRVFPVQVAVADTFGGWLRRTAAAVQTLLVALGGVLTGAASAVIAFLVYRHQRRTAPAVRAPQPRRARRRRRSGAPSPVRHAAAPVAAGGRTPDDPPGEIGEPVPDDLARGPA